MALVLVEGFDHLAASQMTTKGWNTNPASVVAGRFGGQAARHSAAGGFNKPLPSTYSTIYGGFAFRTNQAITQEIFRFSGGGVATCKLLLTSGMVLTVQNSSAATIATGTTALTINAWYYIELKLVIAGASGNVTLQLNQAVEIAQTTGNFGSTNIDAFQLIGLSGPQHDYDDMYALDTTGSVNNTYLGDIAVNTLMPNADGAHTSFSGHPSSSHFANVDEIPPDGDTSYNADSSVGDMDTYLTAGVLPGASVAGIQVNLYARKDDAGLRSVAPVIRQSSLDYPGTTRALTASYVCYTQLYDLDPTSATWTATNINADEYGIEVMA